MSADVEINNISNSITKLRNESYIRGMRDGIKLVQDCINRVCNEQLSAIDKNLNEFEDKRAIVENDDIHEESQDDDFVIC